MEILSPGSERLWFGARLRPTGRTLSVAGVELESPADRAGLRIGDEVLQVNETRPRGLIDFHRLLLENGDRRAVKLEIKRGATPLTLSVRLVPEASVFNAALVRQKTGLSVQEITRELAQRMGLLTTDGLLIAGVDRDSEAERLGIQRGQVLLAFDQMVPTDVIAAARLLHARAPGDKVSVDLLVLRRSGRMIFPSVRPSS
ncbi:MAG: PDZ domain-containing protein [Verrucomicrobia bacterium]|nr:PDZ domain-containing protein [Verrucomicrobiota bacterium]